MSFHAVLLSPGPLSRGRIPHGPSTSASWYGPFTRLRSHGLVPLEVEPQRHRLGFELGGLAPRRVSPMVLLSKFVDSAGRVAPRGRVSRAWLALLFAAATSTAVPVDAAVFHLDDGTTVAGAFVAETAEEVHVLDASGKAVVWSRSQVVYIDWERAVDPKLEKKAKAERERFLKARREEARELVRGYAALPEGSPRADAERRLSGYDTQTQLIAYDLGLRSPDAVTREVCLARLAESGQPAATLPLVRCALYSSDPDLAGRAHDTAVKVHADHTRRLYEYAAAVDRPEHQLAALGQLGRMGDGRSVPFLVRYLHYVTSNVRIQKAQVRNLREVPVSLSGATNVPIELPEISLVEVNTTITVPAQTYQTIRNATVSALEAITGEKHGTDLAAWAAYMERTRAPAEK